MKVHLVIIDPQIDFMDSKGSALPVPGANADMNRLAAMIGRVGNKLEDIHVTLDSHRIIDIAHPATGAVLVDFPAIAQAWLKEMQGRGMTLTTSDAFLA